MHFDFEAALVILTVFTGMVWAFDRLIVRRNKDTKEPMVVEYCRSFFPVILIVLLIRSFLAEPFRIPSSSMVPTLLTGDLILVNKFSYGIRLPVIHTKVIPVGQPERGDVVVFRKPQEPELDYIKRVIGLPGDVVRVDQSGLYINGDRVNHEVRGTYFGRDGSTEDVGATLVVEDLMGVEHEILRKPNAISAFSRNEWTVPEGQYFVMGDNRENSQDSRVWGMVPEENLVGRAFLIWMHLGFSGLDRIGTVID